MLATIAIVIVAVVVFASILYGAKEVAL